MSQLYNPSNKDSIIEFAKQLIGKSVISEFREELKEIRLSNKDKGQLGKVIEQLYFRYAPNSNSHADFKEAGLELKSSGLKQLKNNEFRAKERLVLSIINYFNVIGENFETNFLGGKNGHLLLIFYLYTKGLNQLASEIKLVGDWKYPVEDIEIIKQDWQFIQTKINEGKAHELSEGDTFYLGACTKGANASTTRAQPFSKIPAKQRAYSLKQGYVNHIIASIVGKSDQKFGKLITSKKQLNKQSIEDIVLRKFQPYYGLSDTQITEQHGVSISNSKDFHSRLIKAVLGIELDKDIEEFSKAEIIIKTVRLKENNLPKEDISFPVFKYEELINEKWDESNFKNTLERKFLFVFFQFQNKQLILRKVVFWNMPQTDIQQAKKVWLRTKELVASGDIVKMILDTKRLTNFPSKSFNKVSHVRPHAKNAKDTLPLPVKDKLTNANEYTKHCFWLNNTYVRDEIYLKFNK